MEATTVNGFVCRSDENLAFSEVVVKGEKQYYVEGYVSTYDVDVQNEQVTKSCMKDMNQQMMERSIKFDEDHETILEENLDKNPVARVIEHRVDNKGLWVKALLNSAHSKFKELWGSIKSGMIDAFSIAFLPVDMAKKYVKGKAVRLLEKVKLINIALTGNPVNPEAKMTNIVGKSLDYLEKKGCAEDPDCDREGIKSKIDSAIKFLKSEGYDVKKCVSKKALSATSFPVRQGDYTPGQESESSDKSEDNKNMAEEETSPVETPEVSEPTEEVKETQAPEETPEEKEEEKNETPEEEKSEPEVESPAEPSPLEVEVKSLAAEIKSLTEKVSSLEKENSDLKERLAKPVMKSSQEAQPETTKLNTTPFEGALSLIG